MELKTLCMEALNENDLGALKRALASHPEIAAEPGYLDQLLEFALDSNIEIMEFLAERGADIRQACNPRAPEGLAYYAAMNDNNEALRWVLERGAHVNCEVDGQTQAIAAGHTKVVDFLRSVGAKTPEEQGAIPEAMRPSSFVEHLSRTLGEPVDRVIAEAVPGNPPITIHIVDMPERCQTVLVTEGMSSLPMTVPPGGESFQFAELALCLRDDWPLSEKDLEQESNRWPIGWLRQIAHYPHDNKTWMGGRSVIIANDDPPQPLGPGTRLSCLLAIASPAPYGIWNHPDGKTVVLYDVIPLYTEERDFEKKEGIASLMERFQQYAISPWVNADRVNTCLKLKQ